MRYSIILYLIILHILLVVILIKSDFIDRIKLKFNQREKGESEFYIQMAVHLKRQDFHVPKHSVIFFGDSIVQGLCVSAISTKIVNFGIGTDTTNGLFNRIKEYQSIQKAKAVILYIGVNDVGFCEQRQTLENIKSIIELVPAQTPVYVCSILPVDETILKQKKNSDIDSLNERVRITCSNIDNASFLDFTAQFKDEQGNLKSIFHSGDGLHLNQQGYGQIIASFQDYFRENSPSILN